MGVTHIPLRFVTYIVLTSSVLFVGYAEPSINIFTAWNILPIVVALIILHYTDRAVDSSLPKQLGIYGFVSFTGGVVVIAHLAWLLDWGKTATGSSTSALMFVTLPILALLSGCIGWLIGWCIGLILNRHSN